MTLMKTPKLSLLLAAALLAPAHHAFAQAVNVTMSLGTTNLGVGQSTTLRVFAQVVTNLRGDSDRIFSWYVDVLNTNGAAAVANYAAMQKSASDNDPQISSNGVSQASNRRGIYDTFLNLPGAGVSNAVELMSIPVTGLATGRTRFAVQAGTGVPLMSSDFQVAPKAGGPPYVGGNYTLAFVDLLVTNSCALSLQVARLAQGGGTNGTLRLTFTPCPNQNHTVEFHNTLANTNWQALPGAPHNTGSVTVTNAGTNQRFFRVRASTP